jgi:hypothetical protein
MRRGLLACVLAVSAAAVAQVPMQQPPPDTDFATTVAREINAVVAFTSPDFDLSYGREESALAFYGSGINKLDGVRCERQATFQFVARANLTGGIMAGVCEREARRVQTLSRAAPAAVDAVVAQFSASGPTIDAAMRAKIGWTTSTRVAANGTVEHVFPVIAVGHGVIAAHTVVLVQRGALCERYGLKDKTALCRDTRQALLDIARRLETRFPK